MDMTYDILIIGGGVVGCTTLYELTKNGYKCLLLEKEPNLLSGASSGNSGIWHIPFDTKPGTLEHQCIVNGRAALQNEIIQRNIPHHKSGAIIIATDQTEKQRLTDIYNVARRYRVSKVQLLDGDQVKKMEPNTTDDILGGLLIPEETAVDSCLLPISLAHDAIRMGAKVMCNQNVTAGVRCANKKTWRITTATNTYLGKLVINTAGLYGDHVDKALIGKSNFNIKPRKGEFVIYEKAASKLLRKAMLYPVGTPKTRGVIIFKSVYGNLVIGPTAQDTEERENPSIRKDEIEKMIAYGQKILPELRNYKVIGQYAGLRPATEHSDFQILPDKEKHYITVGGIRSTGLTASFGIAAHVLKLVQDIQGQSSKATTLTPKGGKASFWVTQKPSYVFDGAEYEITHPLMKFGRMKTTSKL